MRREGVDVRMPLEYSEGVSMGITTLHRMRCRPHRRRMPVPDGLSEPQIALIPVQARDMFL